MEERTIKPFSGYLVLFTLLVILIGSAIAVRQKVVNSELFLPIGFILYFAFWAFIL